MADDWKKKDHSSALSALLCIAHVLPLACKSENIVRRIFLDRAAALEPPKNFHAECTLDGWNDGIIQPARNAVLSYYKVWTPPTVLVLKAIN